VAADLTGANFHGIKGDHTGFDRANLTKVRRTDIDLHNAETWQIPDLPDHYVRAEGLIPLSKS
jgi:hypothetical protein